MNPLSAMARFLVVAGIGLILLGVVLYLLPRLGGGWKLPGDIFIQRGNFTFFFPIVTCILLSILLTIVFNVFRR